MRKTTKFLIVTRRAVNRQSLLYHSLREEEKRLRSSIWGNPNICPEPSRPLDNYKKTGVRGMLVSDCPASENE